MAESCLTGADAEFIAIPLHTDGLRLEEELGFRAEDPIDSRGWVGIAAIAADHCGLLFLVDRTGRIWIYDAGEDRTEMIPCLLRFPAPRGLAVSDRTLYLAHVADTGQHRIIALARINWQVRWLWEDKGADLGDLAVDEHEQLFVLDRGRKAVRVLDASGQPVKELRSDALAAPRRLALGQDSQLYLLGGRQVVRLQQDADALPTPTDLVFPDGTTVEPSALTADAFGVLLIGDGRPIAGEEERLIYRFAPAGEPLAALVGYLGPAYHMVWGKQQRLFVVGVDDRIIPIVPRTRFRRQRAFDLTPFDSGSLDTRWHKLVVEGERPDGTRVAMQYRMANTLEELSRRTWSAPLINFTEALVDGDRGRYLEVRGELATNNPAVTPHLRVVIAVFPRRSYLRYLPAIYQEDAASAAFLERFLSIFETLVRRVDAEIDDTPRLIDPAATPAEFLPWLSSWVALGLDAGWSEAQQRRFIAEAVAFYKQRGTREGISRAVEAIVGKPPLIVESWQFRCLQGPTLQASYAQLYGGEDCHFCVLLEPQSTHRPETLGVVRRLVADQVPAHTEAGVMALRPWFHLGMHTYLAINTQLTQPTLVLEQSVLGGGQTALIEHETAGQVERKSRIGLDSSLA
jgi:phage tail-like protein